MLNTEVALAALLVMMLGKYCASIHCRTVKPEEPVLALGGGEATIAGLELTATIVEEEPNDDPE